MLQTNSAVLSNWATLVEGLQASPQEFYAQVDAFVKKRRIPDLQVSMVVWKESGVLSANREYLRVMRGRYLYDICAAPFGTGFFFSSWMTEKLPSPMWAIGGFFLFVFMAMNLLVMFIYMFGISGFLLWVMTLIGAFILLIALLSFENLQFGEYIFVVPSVGPYLEQMFRPNTYYRRDTEAMFRTMVHNAILEAVDATTKAKGVRELTADERKPILHALVKR